MSRKSLHFPFLSMLLLIGLLGLWSCNRGNELDADVAAQVSSLRFDSTMAYDEYQNTSHLLQHPLPAPAGNTQPQLQGVMANKVFTITYQNYATITIGGVAYNHTINEWLAGASAGNVPISPADFATMNNALCHQLRIVIGDNPYWWWPEFTLRTIDFTQVDKGNYAMNGGIYTTDTRNYLYMGNANGVGGQIGSTNCGAVTFGALHGWMGPNYISTNGYFSYNFIAGCSPLVVTASVQFFFTGVANP